MTSDDVESVGCERWQDAISAIADGESPEIDNRLVDSHVARCTSCRSFQRGLATLAVPAKVAPAATIPDLSKSVVRRVTVADRVARWGMVRILLAVVACEVIIVSVPEILTTTGSNAAAHASRHLGAFSVAYAVGLLMVVWRPARARTILPVAAVLAGALVITAVVDIVQGRVPLAGEVGHLPELLSVPLVWLLAVPAPHRLGPWHRARGRSEGGAAPLRLVEADTDAERRNAM